MNHAWALSEVCLSVFYLGGGGGKDAALFCLLYEKLLRKQTIRFHCWVLWMCVPHGRMIDKWIEIRRFDIG